MSKPPYNSDPLDQPAPPSKVSAWQLAAEAVAADPPPGRWVWTSVVHLADVERRNRLVLLSAQAQRKAMQRDSALTEHAQKWADYEYNLIHAQINRVLDELAARPPADLMKRPNISKQMYETIRKTN